MDLSRVKTETRQGRFFEDVFVRAANEPSNREFSLMAERAEFGLDLSTRATSFLRDVSVTSAAIDTYESARRARRRTREVV